VPSTKDAWFKLADQCIKNHGGNDCWKVTSDISPGLHDALKGEYRAFVNRCNKHKGDESACNIVGLMNTTLFTAGCTQPHLLDTDDWTCPPEAGAYAAAPAITLKNEGRGASERQKCDSADEDPVGGPNRTGDGVPAMIEPCAVLYKTDKGDMREILNSMVTFIKVHSYTCNTVSAARPALWHGGFVIVCDRFKHEYWVHDHGGNWEVDVDE
jgi:hypothetical protein